MLNAPVALLDHPDRLRVALSPIRRRLLERLQAPASATEIGAELALGRQRVNYHLRALEVAGLIHLVEKRQRRGCVERIMAARADRFVVDPSVMGAGARPAVSAAAQDRFAANHLIATASAVVRDVARMQARAEAQGERLVTFTIDTEIAFASPSELEAFTTALAAFVAREAARHDASSAGRPYRLVLGGHPAPAAPAGKRKKKNARRATSAVKGEPHHERAEPRHRRNPRRRPH